MSLAEWAPILAAITALAAAVGAVWSSRRKPAVDDATAQKIKTEIDKEQQAARAEERLANAKRDRHITALENWAFTQVRPKWRIASQIVDDQNVLLCKLAARAEIAYTPQHLPELPAMPEIEVDE